MIRPRWGFISGIVWDTVGGFESIRYLLPPPPSSKGGKGTVDWGSHGVGGAALGVSGVRECTPSPPRTSATFHPPAGSWARRERHAVLGCGPHSSCLCSFAKCEKSLLGTHKKRNATKVRDYVLDRIFAFRFIVGLNEKYTCPMRVIHTTHTHTPKR